MAPVWLLCALAVLSVLRPSDAAVRSYELNVTDTVLWPDGYGKIVKVYNGQYPGPLIRVDKGDDVVVRVNNRLLGEGTTVHWHGMSMTGQPFMDGVSQLTQCPISPGESFTYRFKAEEAGTFWYHSHHGVQYGDGLAGLLIVDDPANPYRDQYFAEYMLFINDWDHLPADFAFLNLTNGADTVAWGRSTAEFTSALINGKGISHCQRLRWNFHNREFGCQSPNTIDNVAIFDVTPGKLYRFRIVNAGSQFPFVLSIDSHTMTVISSDGRYVKPKEVSSLKVSIGERYDVLVRANASITGRSVLVRAVVGHIDQFGTTYAALRFPSAPTPLSTDPAIAAALNATDPPRDGAADFSSLHAFSSTAKLPSGLSVEMPIKLTLARNDEGRFVINNRPYEQPVRPLTFAKPAESLYAASENETPLPIYALSEKQVAFVVLENYADYLEHPFHLHGHGAWLLGVGRNGTRYNASSVAELNLVDPPIKDSFSVPGYSWVAFAFVANNPGYWLFHCHVDFDLARGMAVIFADAPDKLPAIPKGFPVCGAPSLSEERTTADCEAILAEADEKETHVLNTSIALIVVAFVALVFASLLLTCRKNV